MRRRSAYSAWQLLMTGFPRGIAMFVVAVTGICAGLGLTVVGIGIPILAGTLAWCTARMKEDRADWGAWSRGQKPQVGPIEAVASSTTISENGDASSWKRWLRTIVHPQSFRAAGYALFQFPLSIAMFVVALTVPVTVLAMLLAPAAYKVSDYLYQFKLFDDEVQQMLLPPLSPFQRSLVVAGIGFLLLLFVPLLLKACGGVYEAWLTLFVGAEAPVAPTAIAESGTQRMNASDWLSKAEAAIQQFDDEQKKPIAAAPDLH